MNVPAALLKTRRGRCGEWANAFTLCCVAVGYRARWVLDVTDHVWTEVHLGARDGGGAPGWVHADPCECVLDAPLMYEKGWGKRLSYVFSFGRDEVVDVAPRYSASWDATLSRRVEVKEGWLELTLASINQSVQARLPPAQRAEVERVAAEERRRLDALCVPEPAGPGGSGPAPAEGEAEGGPHVGSPRPPSPAEPAGVTQSATTAGGTPEAPPDASPDAAPAAEQRGRQTGSLEWRRARGELGGGEAEEGREDRAKRDIHASPAREGARLRPRPNLVPGT